MNFRQLVVKHTMRAKDRAFRDVHEDPINEIVSTKLEQEFLGALLFTLVDVLDTNGTVSKDTLYEMLEKKLDDVETSKAMVSVFKKIAQNLPQEEKDKLMNDVVNKVMNEAPNERDSLS